ncbi:MAG: hypothetical protein JNL33_13885 [Betaproteobacteria bacterium]|nr:hypothetical protein [Betaproteobacteria bacterium]
MRRLFNVPYRLFVLVSTLRRRGLGWGAVCWWVPLEFASRAWRVLARPVNAGLLGASSSATRFRRFLAHEVSGPGCFFVIAMPRTLHCLMPALDLLPGDLPVVIVGNGLRGWERRALARRHPRRPRFDLPVLPGTSQMHGPVLSLFLRCAEHDFGILDHDLYVFDSSLFAQLALGPDECALAVFREVHRRLRLTYPETYFLYFNVRVMRSLMERYGIDARLYREPPASTRERLRELGLGEGEYLKDYQGYFDTLCVLWSVAMAEGKHVRFLEGPAANSVWHVGGTSLGSPRTKDLDQLYVHARFLALLDDREIAVRSRELIRPFDSAEDIRGRMRPGTEAWRIAEEMDRLIPLLREALANRPGRSQPADAGGGDTTAGPHAPETGRA